MEWNYRKEASRWGEANPIGNGHVGGMIYGGVQKDRIDLSEITFYSGAESGLDNQQEGASIAFEKMRAYATKEDFTKVTHEAEKFIGVRNNYGTNLPVGALLFEQIGESPNQISYERSLDFAKGLVTVEYETETNHVKKEGYASWPDKVLIYKIQFEKQGKLQITYENSNEYGEITYSKDGISFLAKAYENLHSDGKSGVHLIGDIRTATDGNVICHENMLQIKDMTTLICYVKMRTNFDRKDISLHTIKSNLKQEMDILLAQDEGILKKRHIEDVAKYMNRVSLKLPVNEQLIESLFQYGRYLLLSSSRTDSLLPTHLQGIWNDNVACRIGWTCDMHLDINTQMNYWPSEITNLSEINAPLFRWILEKLVPAGRVCAEKSYGLKGWVGEIVSNGWGFCAPYWATPISPCPTGGIWILSHMWEHGWYGKNQVFLESIYPICKEAVIFFNDYVFPKQDGTLTSGPSISPENSFLVGEEVYHISNGCTYEIIMIRELFQQFVEMEKFLGNESDLGKIVKEKLELLLPYKVKEDGTIAEWDHAYEAVDLQHRHTSHLLGLYPYSQITIEDTKELAAAAKKTIANKLNPLEQWEDTGWARSMLMLYASRLQEGQKAYEHIQSMCATLLEENHMIIHPPTRGAGSFANVYELDGNTGLTTCIAEMLLQSHQGVIRILPALPKEWDCGKVCGLRARGNIEVDITWSKGIADHIILKSVVGNSYKISYNGKEKEGIFEEETLYFQ